MKKYNKIFLAILSGVLVLTGCSSKDEEKSKTTTSKTTKENKETTKENNENKEVKTETVKLEHNFEEARKLVSDWITVQINSFDFKDKTINRTMPPGLASIPATSSNVKSISLDQGFVYAIPVDELVDVYNTYNRETYDINDVLQDLNTTFKANSTINYTISEGSYANQSGSEIVDKFTKFGTVIYFKGDNKLVYNIPMGLGGANFPLPLAESEWIVDGDTLTIPVKSETDTEVTARVVLKLNNKQYSGGKTNSLYYIYDIKEK